MRYSPKAIMRDIDSMPTKWRALVYDFGYQPVRALLEYGVSYEEAVEELKKWRKFRQEGIFHE